MNQHQETAVRALRALRGDNTYRAKAAFKGMTDRQMQEQHGQNGMTRAALLAQYEAHDEKIDAAIAWVSSIAPNT